MKAILFKTLIAVLLGIIIAKGGLPSLIRLAIPVVIVLLVFKLIKYLIFWKLKSVAKDFEKQFQKGGFNPPPFGHQSNRSQDTVNPSQGSTIEICASCGHESGPNHKCK